MFKKINTFAKENPAKFAGILFGIILVVALIIFFFYQNKSSFTGVLSGAPITAYPPMIFPPLDVVSSGDDMSLYPPDVPEEIGLGMVYPQGDGVAMSEQDSNSFYPYAPGPLLTSYTIPESYGESSLSDPFGMMGAGQGARILKIKNLGNQLNFKPTDSVEKVTYASAYSDSVVQNGGISFVNDHHFTDYSDNFNPDVNLSLQTSPGQSSTLGNCESTYPNVVNYNGLCITKGDIPYGQIVDGQVNPRLVSRWESFTGDYSPQNALQDIDGLLYPTLNVMR
jgi:hypothetical protein